MKLIKKIINKLLKRHPKEPKDGWPRCYWALYQDAKEHQLAYAEWNQGMETYWAETGIQRIVAMNGDFGDFYKISNWYPSELTNLINTMKKKGFIIESESKITNKFLRYAWMTFYCKELQFDLLHCDYFYGLDL